MATTTTAKKATTAKKTVATTASAKKALATKVDVAKVNIKAADAKKIEKWLVLSDEVREILVNVPRIPPEHIGIPANPYLKDARAMMDKLGKVVALKK